MQTETAVVDVGIKGVVSSEVGVGGATLLGPGCELKKKKIRKTRIHSYKIIFKN